jgi:DNA-binding NarL/FixJ family response regulator
MGAGRHAFAAEEEIAVAGSLIILPEHLRAGMLRLIINSPDGCTDGRMERIDVERKVRGRTSEPQRLTGHSLSARELEILNLLAQGLTAKQIGLHLGISFRTVEVHSRSIIDKLGAANRIHAAVIAIRSGLIDA